MGKAKLRSPNEDSTPTFPAEDFPFLGNLEVIAMKLRGIGHLIESQRASDTPSG